MSNGEVARLLHELATLTELEEGSRQSFRARAYQNAVRAIQAESRDVTTLTEAELTAIKGVGKAIAAKVREFADTGTIAKVEQLRRVYPDGYVDLVRVPGVGPKTVALLREHLGIASVSDLEAAVAAGRLRDVPGLGEKTEQNIAASLSKLGLQGKERRTPILDALPIAEDVVTHLRRQQGVQRCEFAGSLRRFRETVADLDVVAAAGDPAPVMRAFVEMPMVREILAHGDKKAAVRTAQGLQIDLRVVAPDEFGAAMQYFTGSKEHNVKVRERAVKRGLLLNEYGLFEAQRDDEGAVVVGRRVASASEEEVYAALELAYVPPGLREDVGEVEAAAAVELPRLPTVADLRGDLHVHTDLSGDGRASLEAMVDGCAARGLEYVAITDHAEDLTINGVSRAGMLAQRAQIARLNEARSDIRILHGSELNIGRDGTLDYDAEFLAGFDWTVASVHSHFRLDRDSQTRRVLAAMHHPSVSAIGHLTGRRIGKRPGIDLDVRAVLEAAATTGTAIELNCHLDRLDAPAEVLRAARGLDVVFVISTDAHRVGELDNARHGVRLAERGWVPVEQVANTWPFERFWAWVRDKPARVA